MSKVLLIVTKPNDSYNEAIMAHEHDLPGYELKVVNLTSGEPDYDDLLEQIFSADSIQVW